MAVEHVETVPGHVAGEHKDDFVPAEEHYVLERGGFVRQDRSVALARDDLEVNEMNMDGMGPAAAFVLEFPEFDGASGWPGEDAVVDVVEGDAVDLPFALFMLKFEDVIRVRQVLGRWDWERFECGRQRAIVGLVRHYCADVELHHLVRILERSIGLSDEEVLHKD